MLKKSINTIMIGYISIIILISIGSLVIYVSNSSQKIALQMEEESLSTVADCILRSFEDFIQSGIVTAGNLAHREDIVDSLEGEGSRDAMQIFSNYIKKNKGIIASAFSFDLQGHAIAGYNIEGEAIKGDYSHWEAVQAILKRKKLFISPTLTKSPSTGKLIGIISVPVKNDDGQLIGGLALCPDLNVLFDRHIDTLHFGKNGYAFVLDEKGIVLSHPDPKNILKSMAQVDFASYAIKHKNGSTNYTHGGEKKFLLFKQVPHVHWIIGLTANHSEMAAGAMRQRNVLIGVGVVVILAVIFAISLISRRLIFAPLARIMAFVNKVAHGDYQATLKGTFKYEPAELADNIKAMVAEIKNKIGFSEGVLQGIVIPCSLIGPDNKMLWANQEIITLLGLSQSPEKIVGWHAGKFFFGDESRKCLSETALQERRQISGENNEYINHAGEKKAVSMTTTPFYDMDGKILGTISFWLDLTDIKAQQLRIEAQNEKIAATAREAFAVADQMAGASEELSAQIEQSSKGTDIQRQRVTETATSMEEMNSTVLEVARNASGAAEGADHAKTKAEEGQKIVESAINAITQVQNQAQELKTNMETLGQQAEDIGNVMNVISDIADQTNLLALNAAIEAARAGEAGRGFAVVADEVRKLAEKTMTATKEVGDAIENIQEGTRGAAVGMDNAVQSVEEATTLAGRSGEALKEIVGLVDQASDQVRSIATASEEQSASSEEINMAVSEINRISSETAEAMEQSASAIADLARLAQELNRLIQDLQDS